MPQRHSKFHPGFLFFARAAGPDDLLLVVAERSRVRRMTGCFDAV
jgi:hypothetical protein